MGLLTNEKKKSLVAIVLLLLCINLFSFQVIEISGQEETSIPFNLEEINSVKYILNQELNHYSEGNFQGQGEISVEYDHQVPGTIYLDLFYNLSIWQKPCSNAVEVKDEVYIELNKTTRFIEATGDQFVNLSLDGYGLYGHWYLGDYFSPESKKTYFIEDLLFLHGERFNNTFEFKTDSKIFLNGQIIDCYQLEWTGQLIYAGYICSIGSNPYFNCTVNYYFEKNSGLLVYSESEILEYLYDDPNIFQHHSIEKYLIDVNDKKLDDTEGSNKNSTETGVNWPWEGEKSNDFMALAIIFSIIVGGILAILIINKSIKKRNLKALLENEKIIKTNQDSDNKKTE